MLYALWEIIQTIKSVWINSGNCLTSTYSIEIVGIPCKSPVSQITSLLLPVSRYGIWLSHLVSKSPPQNNVCPHSSGFIYNSLGLHWSNVSAKDCPDLSGEVEPFGPGPVGSWLEKVIQDIQHTTFNITYRTNNITILKRSRNSG